MFVSHIRVINMYFQWTVTFYLYNSSSGRKNSMKKKIIVDAFSDTVIILQ
jgi:hypothetical protein